MLPVSPNLYWVKSCQHAGAINKSEVEKVGTSLMGSSTEFKKDASFFIISAEKLALETTMVAPSQCQLQRDYGTSGARSYLKQVFIVKCTSCDKSIGLLIDGEYQCLNIRLHNEKKPNGWIKVECDSDRLVFFILSQLVYREHETPDENQLQVEYALPSPTDITKLLWVNGNAVGFYTVKPKGALDFESFECYSMTVLDTLFIRISSRRQGYAMSAIKDLLEQYPDENVGLSFPISLPMVKVLKKHLEVHPDDKMKLWEVTGCGTEGNCQIIWYILKKLQS